MTDLEIFAAIVRTVNEFGLTGFVIWMLLTESKRHQETIKNYMRDLRKIAKIHDPDDDERP